MTRATIRQRVMTCFVCGKDVIGELAMDMDTTRPLEVANPSEPGGKPTMEMQGTVLGMLVQHDCRPKLTREALAEQWFPGAAET